MTDASISNINASPAYHELVEGVRATFQAGRTRSLEWRRAQLKGILTFLSDYESELVAALREDLGRHEAEAFAADIGISRLHIKHTLRHFERWARPSAVSAGVLTFPARAQVIHEPLGVVLVISPWNYPIQLLLEPMAAALAAGNAVIAKPSELSPACSAVMGANLPKYLDPDAIAIVEGGVPETTALLNEQFDHIFFTGSTNVGKVVMAAAAKHLTPVTLELGGKSPTIVDEVVNLEVAARRVAWGKFINAGQTCIAPDYVLVHRRVRDQFVELLTKTISEFYGSEHDQSPYFGRIINERHHARLMSLIATGGGVAAIGGTGDAATRYVAPTVIVDPDLDAPLMTEEIFGPVLPVVAVDSIDEAIRFVNDRPKPLALYVFTKSSAHADRVLAETSSGGACVNHVVVHITSDTLPFGGVGPSGMGAYHGKAGFDQLSHHKSVVRKPTFPDPTLLYPPYDDWKTKVLRFVMR